MIVMVIVIVIVMWNDIISVGYDGRRSGLFSAPLDRKIWQQQNKRIVLKTHTAYCILHIHVHVLLLYAGARSRLSVPGDVGM